MPSGFEWLIIIGLLGGIAAAVAAAKGAFTQQQSRSAIAEIMHRAPPRFWAYVTIVWAILMLGVVKHYFDPPAWERSVGESLVTALGLTVMLGVLLLVMYFPISIAENRGISQDALKSVKLLALLGLFFGITWIVALIWACLAPVAAVRGNDGPGLYEVHGVDKGTGYDVTDRIRADSVGNARIKAELRGIVVSACVQIAES